MKDYKLGVKLVCGFLVCAAITLGVGLVSLWGLTTIGEQLNMVAGINLPAVRDLLHIKISGESIRVAQRTLLVPSLTSKDRSRQFENIEALRTSYRQSWQEYDGLPKSSEEERLWKDVAAAWQQWAAGNNESFDLARSWDKTGINDPHATRSQVERFRGDILKIANEATASALFATPHSFDVSVFKAFDAWMDSSGRAIENPVYKNCCRS